MSKPVAFNRASAEAQARRKANDAIFVQAAAQGLPTCSWWTEARDRSEFAARAKREAERMSWSPMGGSAKIVHAKDTEKVDRE